MKGTIRLHSAALVCLALAAASLVSTGEAKSEGPAAAASRAIRFVHGRWFNGESFESRTLYSVDGVLRPKYDGPVDSTIDLQNRFIVPPFAEAHNHHFMEGMDYRSQIETYFRQGVFYAKNPNSIPAMTEPVRQHFNRPASIDVVYSNGGLTSTGGHPVQIYDYLARRGYVPGWTEKDMKDQAYYIIDTEADLDSQWELIKSRKPDFIKAYLEYSEEHDLRKGDPRFYGQRGLDPKLLPKIVAKAHKDKLRVSVHVNTAADFHNAVAAGADEIAHLPLARIAEEDAIRAARQGTVVVTTTLSHRRTDHVKGLEELFRDNLKLLARHGVRIAIGTDDNGRTVLDEALNLHRLGVFDNLTLLKMWSVVTPQAIFPGRRIGRFEDGYEASFLALDADPLSDFSNVKRISFRLKQGEIIKVADKPEQKQNTAAPVKH